jgi:hypothetical protein
MGGKASAPPPPDYSAVAQASKESAELSYKLGKEQLEWAKETYATDKQVTDQIVQGALSDQDINRANALEDRARYESSFQPLEDSLARDAQTYASPERKELERGRAAGQVAQQFEGARNAAIQNLEAYGVDPTSARFASLDQSSRVQEAATKAAAANQSDQAVDAQSRALRSEAVNVGRGYPGQIAGQYATTLQSGQQAGNQQLAQTASGANTMGTATQWQGLGNQAVGQWANTLNMGYQNQLAAFKANQDSSSGWGSAAGLGVGLLSKMIPAFEDGGAVDEGAAQMAAVDAGPPRTSGVPQHSRRVPEAASPSMGKAVDDVPARLTVGEFVVPKEAVSWFGEKHFQTLIQKAEQERSGATAKPKVKQAVSERPSFSTAVPA